MARIHPRADLKDVVTFPVRFAEALQRVTKSYPSSPSRRDTSQLQALNSRAILLKNGRAPFLQPVSRPILTRNVLLPEKPVAAMRRCHVCRKNMEIASDAKNQYAMPNLSRAVVGGVHKLPDNLEFLSRLRRHEPRAMRRVRLARLPDQPRPLQMRDNPFKVRAETGTCEIPDILEEKRSRHCLTHRSDGFRPHVAVVVLTLLLTANSERLAWGAT